MPKIHSVIKASFDYQYSANKYITVLATATYVNQSGDTKDLTLRFYTTEGEPILNMVYNKELFRDIEFDAICALLEVQETPEVDFGAFDTMP